jgi:hypothetical protein
VGHGRARVAIMRDETMIRDSSAPDAGGALRWDSGARATSAVQQAVQSAAVPPAFHRTLAATVRMVPSGPPTTLFFASKRRLDDFAVMLRREALKVVQQPNSPLTAAQSLKVHLSFNTGKRSGLATFTPQTDTVRDKLRGLLTGGWRLEVVDGDLQAVIELRLVQRKGLTVRMAHWLTPPLLRGAG